MLQGVCIDSSRTTTLTKDKLYFLYPNGEKHVYVSNFPNKNSHKGCYESSRFKLIEKEEWPPEPKVIIPELVVGKIYRARLNWRPKGYRNKPLQEYFLEPKKSKTHAYFFFDKELKQFGGNFPIHWFDSFQDIEVEEDLSVKFIEYLIEQNPPITTKVAKNKEPEISKYEQLSLF